LFSGLTKLASSVIDIWLLFEQRKLGQLEREHRERLQRAQHEHELLLLRRKAEPARTEARGAIGPDSFMARLNKDAILLFQMGFEVVYEPIRDGYGLALIIDQDFTIAFWMSPDYPVMAPQVFIHSADVIDRIDFGLGAWEEDHTLAEVVSAITLEM
jgi:hypothetical protein